MPVFPAVLPAALLAFQPAQAVPADAKQAVAQAYQTMDKAFMRRDADALFAFFTPDAIIISGGQKTTAKEAQAGFKSFMPQWTGELHQVTVLTKWTAAPGGGHVVVLTTQTLDGTFQKQKTHFVAQGRDTWKKTGAGWRISKSETLKEDVSMLPIPPAITPAEQKAVLTELQTRLVPLASVEPSHDFADLAPIGAAIGAARIVSLGEAGHGTREFFQMKHRLLEYLVKQKGFSVFAMEANFPEVLAVDGYIKTGQGDGQTALAKTYFWTWYTREVLDMIEWMRTYNKTRPAGSAALTFTGFDMQTPDVAAKQAQAFLQKVSPSDGKTAQNNYAKIAAINRAQNARSGASMALPSIALASAVLGLFDTHRDQYIKASSQTAYGVARQCALVVVQAQNQTAFPLLKQLELRDAAMAQNVRWLASTAHPNAKIVLWAHNGHVGTQTYGGVMGIKSMGMHLRETFGPEMYVVGFAFNKGSIRAVPMSGGQMIGPAQPLPVPPAAPGTGDALFALAHQPRFFLDMRTVPADGSLGKWLANDQLFRMPGAAWDKNHADNFAAPAKLSQTFDGVIFVDESHASQALGPVAFAKKAAAPVATPTKK